MLEQVAEAFGERYRVERELGRGGMATVYLVTAGSQSGTQFVSLAVDERVAQRVADAAAAQLLRLVLRPGGAG